MPAPFRGRDEGAGNSLSSRIRPRKCPSAATLKRVPAERPNSHVSEPITWQYSRLLLHLLERRAFGESLPNPLGDWLQLPDLQAGRRLLFTSVLNARVLSLRESTAMATLHFVNHAFGSPRRQHGISASGFL